jgi:hypothetical protein
MRLRALAKWLCRCHTKQGTGRLLQPRLCHGLGAVVTGRMFCAGIPPRIPVDIMEYPT